MKSASANTSLVVLLLSIVFLAAGCGGSGGPSSGVRSAAAETDCSATSRPGLTVVNSLQRQLAFRVEDARNFTETPGPFTQSAGIRRDHFFPASTCATLTLVVDAGGSEPVRIPMAVGSTIYRAATPNSADFWEPHTLVYGSEPVTTGSTFEPLENCPSAPTISFTWSESSPLGSKNLPARATLVCSPQDGYEYATLTISGDLPDR